MRNLSYLETGDVSTEGVRGEPVVQQDDLGDNGGDLGDIEDVRFLNSEYEFGESDGV